MKRTLAYIIFLVTSIFAVKGADVAAMSNFEAYPDWYNVEFNGRVSLKKLKVSPSVKIYMVRDSLLQISLRAPMVGEVGRLTLTHDRLQLVNKLGKTYCEESIEKLFEMYPSVLSDIQSLLLARVVIFTKGELSPQNAELVEVQPMDNGNYIVLPQQSDTPSLKKFKYGYILSPTGRTLVSLFNVENDGSLDLRYTYNQGQLLIKAVYEDLRWKGIGKNKDKDKGKETTVNLNFDSVKWGGQEMAPAKIGGYTKLDIKKFLQNI